jgi:N-acetylneuraminate synthase/N,N'-diacetyllegionaminate synthase
LKIEIIAEIGQNHNGDMGLAFELINAAKESGADVAKFQLYDASNLFSRKNNEWFEYNCKTELKQDQINILAEECSRVGIEFMASVFDVERIKWLEDVGVRRYKVASRSIGDMALIKAIAATGKPLLISLGMWHESNFPSIEADGGVGFLYCISSYPALLDELHFGEVDFERYVGFSDHTIGIHASQIALARGASILEKHFTLDKKMYGPDHAGSMTPNELHDLNTFRLNLLQAI